MLNMVQSRLNSSAISPQQSLPINAISRVANEGGMIPSRTRLG
jgi:hypothetical protein